MVADVNSKTSKSNKQQTVRTGIKRENFTMYPNELAQDPTFSAASKATSLYLLSKPTGWTPRPSDIQKQMGYGEAVWFRVSKELKDRKILTEARTQGGTELLFEISWKEG